MNRVLLVLKVQLKWSSFLQSFCRPKVTRESQAFLGRVDRRDFLEEEEREEEETPSWCSVKESRACWASLDPGALLDFLVQTDQQDLGVWWETSELQVRQGDPDRRGNEETRVILERYCFKMELISEALKGSGGFLDPRAFLETPASWGGPDPQELRG